MRNVDRITTKEISSLRAGVEVDLIYLINATKTVLDYSGEPNEQYQKIFDELIKLYEEVPSSLTLLKQKLVETKN